MYRILRGVSQVSVALWRALVLGLVVAAMPAVADTDKAPAAADDRYILVAFAEPELTNAPSAPAGQEYRARGDYSLSRWVRRAARSLARDYDLTSVADWPITTLKVSCVVYRIRDNVDRASVLAALSRDKRVALAQEMLDYRTLSHTYDDPYAKLQTESLGYDVSRLHSWATGNGVLIAVVDTGVDTNHPDLQGQVTTSRNLATTYSSSFEQDTHGTAVAGIIAAKADNAEGIVGVAPKSKLIALKACWPETQGALNSRCNSFSVALALNTAVESGAKIMNLSISGPTDPLNTALIEEAMARGIIVIAAQDSDGTRPFPANVPGVIAVSDVATSPSSTTPHSVNIANSRILTTIPNARYEFLSGASFAAAQMSGLAALVLEMNAGAQADDVLKALEPLDDVMIKRN